MERRGGRLLRPTADRERGSGLRVAVIGDFGSNDAVEAGVAALVRSWNPDLIATVGDNNYPNGSAETIDANIGKYFHDFIAPYAGRFGAGARTNRFFPGSETTTRKRRAPALLRLLELPGNERYYAVRRGEVELFFLDSDEHEPDGISRDSVQAEWLRTALAASPARYRLVLFHHPPYSSGQHHSSPTLQWPFREWGATTVLTGHDHDYERIDRAGMPYVVVGTGGKRLYGFSVDRGRQSGPRCEAAWRAADRGARGARERALRDVGRDASSTASRCPRRASCPPDVARRCGLALEVPRRGRRRQGTPGVRASSTTRAGRSRGSRSRSPRTRLPTCRASSAASSTSPTRRRSAGSSSRSPVDDEVVAHLNGVEVAHTSSPASRWKAGPAGSAKSTRWSIRARSWRERISSRSSCGIAADLRTPAASTRGLLAYAAPAQLVGMGQPGSICTTAAALRRPAGRRPASTTRAGPAARRRSLGAVVGSSVGGRARSGVAPVRLRAEFSVARGSGYRELLLRMARSDAGIAYLNRVEVARWNLPEPESRRWRPHRL